MVWGELRDEGLVTAATLLVIRLHETLLKPFKHSPFCTGSSFQGFLFQQIHTPCGPGSIHPAQPPDCIYALIPECRFSEPFLSNCCLLGSFPVTSAVVSLTPGTPRTLSQPLLSFKPPSLGHPLRSFGFSYYLWVESPQLPLSLSAHSSPDFSFQNLLSDSAKNSLESLRRE